MTQTTEMDQLNAQLFVAKALIEDNQSQADEAFNLARAAENYVEDALNDIREVTQADITDATNHETKALKIEFEAFNRVNESEAEVTRIEAEIAALKAKTK
jgi:uncharacterized protein YktB (UPF0637 family)